MIVRNSLAWGPSPPLSHSKARTRALGTPFPLLHREWRLRLQRKQSGLQGSYPGLFWSALALSLPVLHRGLESYGFEPFFPFQLTFSLTGLWMIWLTCLRACSGCAVSMAEAVQNHSVPLLRRLPGFGGVAGLMTSKAILTALPILLEWAAFLLVAWLTFAWDFDPLRFLAVGLCSLAFFSTLGLWIGTAVGECDRAANNALVAVVMTLVGWSLLEYVVKGPILLGVAIFWVTLVFRSNPRVASILQGLIGIATLLFLFTQVTQVGELHLAQLSPLSAAIQPALTRDDCLLYLFLGVLIAFLNYRQLRRL